MNRRRFVILGTGCIGFTAGCLGSSSEESLDGEVVNNVDQLEVSGIETPIEQTAQRDETLLITGMLENTGDNTIDVDVVAEFKADDGVSLGSFEQYIGTSGAADPIAANTRVEFRVGYNDGPPEEVAEYTLTIGSTSTSSPDSDDTENQDQTEEQVGSFHEGFEEDMNLWSIEQSNWSRSTEYAHEGEHSAGIEMGRSDTENYLRTVASATPPILEDGSQIKEFSFYWLEMEESFGGGVRLLNSDNEVEIGIGTDNPSWIVDSVNGPMEVDGGDGYGRWIRSDILIDWSDGTVEISFKDTQSNETYSGQHELKHGTDIETIQIRGFTSNQGWQTESCHMYWDDFVISDGS